MTGCYFNESPDVLHDPGRRYRVDLAPRSQLSIGVGAPGEELASVRESEGVSIPTDNLGRELHKDTYYCRVTHTVMSIKVDQDITVHICTNIRTYIHT